MKDGIEKDLSLALWGLLGTKDIDDISVGEILAVSNWGRSSFYRAFEDKYDLLWHTLRRVTEPSGFLNANAPLSAGSALLFLRVAEKARTHFCHAFSTSEQVSQRIKLISLCSQKTLLFFKSLHISLCGEQLDVRCSIYSYEVVGMFFAWLEGNVPVSAEDLLAIYIRNLAYLKTNVTREQCAENVSA